MPDEEIVQINQEKTKFFQESQVIDYAAKLNKLLTLIFGNKEFEEKANNFFSILKQDSKHEIASNENEHDNNGDDAFNSDNRNQILNCLDEFTLLIFQFEKQNNLKLEGEDDYSLLLEICLFKYLGLSKKGIFNKFIEKVEEENKVKLSDIKPKGENDQDLYVEYLNGKNSDEEEQAFIDAKENFADNAKNVITLAEALSSFRCKLDLSEKSGGILKEKLLADYLKKKASCWTRLCGSLTRSLYANQYAYDDEMEMEEERWKACLNENFVLIQSEISAREDYKQVKSLSEEMKKIIWYLSSYLIGFPRKTSKHDRDEELEQFIESLYQAYETLDDANGESVFLPENKLDKISALLKDFLPKSGTKTVYALVNYSLRSLEKLKAETFKKKESNNLPIEQNCKEKSLSKKYSSLPLNNILTQPVIMTDLLSVPFKVLAKKREEYKGSFLNNNCVCKFFRFLRYLFSKNNEMVTYLRNERLLHNLPEEIQKRGCFHKFVKDIKNEYNAKTNARYIFMSPQKTVAHKNETYEKDKVSYDPRLLKNSCRESYRRHSIDLAHVTPFVPYIPF